MRNVKGSALVHERRRLQIAEATAGLFENSRMPMWIYDLRTLSFLAVNDAAVECYGYSREEFLAMTVRQLHLPAERSALLDGALKPPVSSVRERTWQHVKKDGTVIYLEVARSRRGFRGRERMFGHRKRCQRRQEIRVAVPDADGYHSLVGPAA